MEQGTNLILFELLRSAVCGEPVSDDKKGNFSAEHIPQLYALSNKHDLAHIVGYALIQNRLIDEKNEYYGKFQKKQLQAIYRYEQSEYELQCISEIFEKENIPFIPLKGAVIRKYYPEPWFRTSCDIDILIEHKDISRACQMLERELDYTAEGKENYHDISLFSPSGVHLELHFNIKENTKNLDLLLDRAWEYVSPIRRNSMEYAMTNEYLMFHLVAHTAYHFVHGGCGIKPFVDLYILEKGMEYDREEFKKLCEICHLTTFLNSAEMLVNAWFTGEGRSELTESMENYIFDGGAYGSKEQSVAVESKKNGGRSGYILQRIFMPFDSLKIQYPILKKYPFLLPFCHIARWSRLIFKGRLKRSVRELKITTELDANKTDNISALMKSLEL